MQGCTRPIPLQGWAPSRVICFALLILVVNILGIGTIVDMTVSQAPITNNDTVVIYNSNQVDIYVLMNDVNPRGGPMTITSVSSPPIEYGTLLISPDSTYIIYTPAMIGKSTNHHFGNFLATYVVKNDVLSSVGYVSITSALVKEKAAIFQSTTQKQ